LPPAPVMPTVLIASVFVIVFPRETQVLARQPHLSGTRSNRTVEIDRSARRICSGE
jgi:hypothetical protein